MQQGFFLKLIMHVCRTISATLSHNRKFFAQMFQNAECVTPWISWKKIPVEYAGLANDVTVAKNCSSQPSFWLETKSISRQRRDDGFMYNLARIVVHQTMDYVKGFPVSSNILFVQSKSRPLTRPSLRLEGRRSATSAVLGQTPQYYYYRCCSYWCK